MPNSRLNTDIIAAAIEGYEAQKSRIDEKIAELRQMLSGPGGEADATRKAAAPRRKRRLSAAGRKRIAEAARKRWAALREQKAQGSPATKKAGRKRAPKENPA